MKRLAHELWGESRSAAEITERPVGKGRIITGAGIQPGPGQTGGELYPEERVIRQILDRIGVVPDFEADRDLRFTHRRDGAIDVYFVANPQPTAVTATCRFRITGKRPELWDPVTGEMRLASAFRQENGRTSIPLELPPSGSLFVLFRQPSDKLHSQGRNFPEHQGVQKLRPLDRTLRSPVGRTGVGRLPHPGRLDQPPRGRHQVLFRHGSLHHDLDPAISRRLAPRSGSSWIWAA